MSDRPANDPRDEFMEKSRRLLNMQMNAMLKWQQSRTEIWKVVVAAMGAGAMLITAGAVIGAVLSHVFAR